MIAAGAIYFTISVKIVLIEEDCTLASLKNLSMLQDQPTNSASIRPPMMRELFKIVSAISKISWNRR